MAARDEGERARHSGSPAIHAPFPNWLKFTNPAAPAVKREAEEDWGKALALSG
jgi:hypothetical protein